MYKFITIAATLVIIACGVETINKRTYRGKAKKEWVVVAQTALNVKTAKVFGAVATETTTITYTEPVKGKLDLEPSALVTVDNDETLTLGSILIKKLVVNKLKVCGVGGDERCTVAAVRVYSTGAISGFVNTLDGYGVPITVNGQTLPLTQPNGAILTSYTIPISDRRVTKTDILDIDYPLVVDMSNAGNGDYEVNIVIEVVLGN